MVVKIYVSGISGNKEVSACDKWFSAMSSDVAQYSSTVAGSHDIRLRCLVGQAILGTTAVVVVIAVSDYNANGKH